MKFILLVILSNWLVWGLVIKLRKMELVQTKSIKKLEAVENEIEDVFDSILNNTEKCIEILDDMNNVTKAMVEVEEVENHE